MSRTTSRSSSSSTDDSDHESAGGPYYSSQVNDGGGPAAINSASMMSPDSRLDVNNILNPTPRTLEAPRRKSAAHFESPRSASMANLQNTARSLPPSPIESSDPSDASRYRSSTLSRQLAQPGTRLSRPSSLGNVTPQQHPYGYSSRSFSTYSAENIPPGSYPQLPSSAAQSNYSFLSGQVSHQYPLQQPQQQSQQSYQSQQSVSTSVSPTSPYSYVPGQSTSGGQTGIYSNQQYGSNQQPLGSPYSIASHSQHGHFPMMALATAHGSIPVSVDTTAASKSADEKRKRNAGASARFRQRRKEREREMTQRITDLEQRLKKAEEERDYYRDMCMRNQSGRNQPAPVPPPPPPPPAQSQHSNPHSHQYSHHAPPRLGHPPSQPMTLDPPVYGHRGSHPPPPPTPPFPRIGSDVGSGYREGGSSMTGAGYQASAPGVYQHHQQQPAPPQRRDSMTPNLNTNLQRREGDRYEQELGRHH
ncbi:hypothetical protein L211DRAFT_851342 [Terfezia boudieri ATCC MYA-4762]|uniref:BZIP domain-containing protein n=1 Tax=Terfezia boudieri ATCC MYA-4762 TaxID=1051890 RepID=A0A3N4LUD8_9PEZI|nr:hypothetical protein L211DRAFT_851342 [Terfezia boudieri ATCC MYA-4762]